MKKELIIKKCLKCGALVKVINDCACKDCGIKCCNAEMTLVIANSADAAMEKHVPNYEIVGNKLVVTVNHVMESDHYIEWIALVSNSNVNTFYLNPSEVAKVEFPLVKEGILYSYCNKHGLWKEEIK